MTVNEDTHNCITGVRQKNKLLKHQHHQQPRIPTAPAPTATTNSSNKQQQ